MGFKFLPKRLFGGIVTFYMCKYVLSSIFNIYVHKYVYFNIIMPNRLGRLTPFKHHLNGLNAKQRATDYLPFSV